jgi:hypothetical protein
MRRAYQLLQPLAFQKKGAAKRHRRPLRRLEDEKGISANLPVRDYKPKENFEGFGLNVHAMLKMLQSKELHFKPETLKKAVKDILMLDGLLSVWQAK